MASSVSLSDDPEGSIIAYYFSRGYKYEVITEFLSKFHGITMCVRTLKNRLRQLKLRRRMASVDMDVVREQIMNELSGPGCQGGYRSVWHTLRLQNIQVPRHVVAELMREMDPEGCERRKSKSFKRRSYFSSGPNYTWHVDGYDKLKPYGFPIHECIDGWSRKIMWLKVTKSNNHPDIIASFFLNCVEELGGCPVKLRTDCGTENGVMAAMQCTFQQSADAHKYGSSPANQRIESWWSFYRKNRCGWWMEFFKSLVEHEIFNPGDEIQMACLWFCFAHLLQDDLDKVKEHWNTHLIRGSRYDTISGRPDELFFLPELHGGEDGLLHPILDDEIQSIRENLTYEEEQTIYQEYFEYVLENTDLQLPNNFEQGLSLYKQLLEIANID
ncbi:uncharacterized protein [Montipora foliosa]|uniref:uncharacterized protein n=1 Tax=Montipora foliosa TaxID=591990 RepID=UPI0035F11AF1